MINQRPSRVKGIKERHRPVSLFLHVLATKPKLKPTLAASEVCSANGLLESLAGDGLDVHGSRQHSPGDHELIGEGNACRSIPRPTCEQL